jgi:hypothetical protein
MNIHLSTAWRILLTLALSIGMARILAHSARVADPCTIDPVVNSDFDDGSDGTLRWAIGAACSGSTITFDADHTIHPALPA